MHGSDRVAEVSIFATEDVAERNVIIAGDRAIEEGEFTLKVAPRDGGAAVEDRGRFMAIWERRPT